MQAVDQCGYIFNLLKKFHDSIRVRGKCGTGGDECFEDFEECGVSEEDNTVLK